MRRRVVVHLKEKLRAFEAQLLTERAGVRCLRFDREILEALTAMLSSYLGHFKSASCWHLWCSLWRRFPFLSHYFAFDAERWKLVRKYPAPRGLLPVKRQYRYWRRRLAGDVLFFQVGRFMECYDAGTPDWVRWLGLKPIGRNRRGARYGFPVGQAGKHLHALLGQGRVVTVIAERRDDGRGILEREPVCRYLPAPRAGQG